MILIEHDNRKKAKALAEYITGQELRLYLADKVKKYVGENVSVFDGAAGSGQLEQHIKPSKFVAVEIQFEACKALATNYPSATINNKSFFNYQSDVMMDCVVMNPPFSIAFKDLSDIEQANIKADFAWKKSGKVDDIFVLKSMKYSKRFGFFILFLGVGYRNSEKQFRQLIGNQIVELNVIKNAFDDTGIDVMFLVLDKQKSVDICHRELYDCKSKNIINQDNWTIDSECWQYIQPPEPFKDEIDSIALEIQAREQTKSSLVAQIALSKVVAVFEPVLADSFDEWLDELCVAVQAERLSV